MLSSKKLEESAMDVGADIICMVKSNTKRFCKDTIENIRNKFPAGYYLVLSSKLMLPGYSPIIDIG